MATNAILKPERIVIVLDDDPDTIDTRRTWALDRPYVGHYPTTVRAHTKGEARALFKAILKEPVRLPIGYEVVEVPSG